MDVPLNFTRQNFNRPSMDRFEREKPEDSTSFSEILEQLAGFVRRQFPIFVFILASAIALGVVYLFTTPPSYTSHAMLLIDSSKIRILQKQDASLGDLPIDSAQVETQVEILKSENIGLSVVKDLKLSDDPEFTGPGGGLIGKILDLFLATATQSETGLIRKALATFLAKRTVARVGRTYVLDIGFTSLDSSRSATIANAVADAYIVDQLEAKYQATRRASGWLQDRIKELRNQASSADRAVLDYKEKNNIVAVGGNSGGNSPRLLGEQQLEELNTQLGTARAAAEEAKARLERITEVLKKDVPEATVTDSLHSEVINRLRNNYLDLAAKESIWSVRYGPNHLATVNLRTQMAELRRSILDELGRIAQGYKSDYEIAKSRADGLERNLENLVANSQVINRDRLGLTDLESTAKVYHTIYDNFLQRYMEAIQQQSFPITEARVISAAAPPQRKSAPLMPVVLGVASAIGLLLSFGAAFLREVVDQVFRTPRQVEANLNTQCLVVLQRLVDPKSSKGKRSVAVGFGNHRVQSEAKPALVGGGPELNNPSILPELAPSVVNRSSSNDYRIGHSEKAAANRAIVPIRPFLRQVIVEPLSTFAEAFRSIKVAADVSGSRVIGITSTVPGEGKSTISSNLAGLIAHTGKRMILLDGDLRNPSLTRGLAPSSKVGLLEVLNGEIALDAAVYVDAETGLRFLPSVVSSRVDYTNEILASDTFKTFVEGLRKDYDYVIIDLSPVAPVVDVRATTQIIDSYIYVVEWGKTKVSLVQQQLSSFPELYDRLLGVVLNKADIRVLARYETYYGSYHYKNYYGGHNPDVTEAE